MAVSHGECGRRVRVLASSHPPIAWRHQLVIQLQQHCAPLLFAQRFRSSDVTFFLALPSPPPNKAVCLAGQHPTQSVSQSAAKTTAQQDRYAHGGRGGEERKHIADISEPVTSRNNAESDAEIARISARKRTTTTSLFRNSSAAELAYATGERRERE